MDTNINIHTATHTLKLPNFGRQSEEDNSLNPDKKVEVCRSEEKIYLAESSQSIIVINYQSITC